MSLAVQITSRVSVVETLEGELINPANATVTSDQLTEDLNLTSSTTPPVEKHGGGELVLSSGSGSIDLTAIPGLTDDETVDGTGLKLQYLKLRNKSTNANLLTITKGASNGYGLDSAGGSWTVVLDPGQSVLFSLDDAAPDVASGAKTIDVSGTGSQVLEYHAVLG